ncbi:hypothetical protein Ddc_14238 [Ditylenchus destructor]|nr:hypothetical protein Ddc_14238 [Ditylenchus destructor]
MSCSKPLPPFVCDSLYYLNRDQLERFSIVCRPLKNFIKRYFHSKPYRLFDILSIFAGFVFESDLRFNLFHNDVRWHPNRDDYNAQQFLAGQECKSIDDVTCYSFAEMRPYLVPTVRISKTNINIDGYRDCTYNPEQITGMESIAYLWRDYTIEIRDYNSGCRIDDEVMNDILPILNSTILKCRLLEMTNAYFPFKDYKVLYTAFSFAVVPNVFKIVVFVDFDQIPPLTEFRKTNKNSGEILELKKGCPAECQEEYSGHIDMKNYDIYTLERSNI